MEYVLHSPHKGSGSIHVSCHHDLAGKAAEGCLDCLVLHNVWMDSGWEVGVTEIYLTAESSPGYRILYSILFWDLCVSGLGVIIPEAEV